jgi:uncharacterized membrane protein YhaH (DUF805 family)
MFCGACGFANSVSSRFCVSCGSQMPKLGETTVLPPPAAVDALPTDSIQQTIKEDGFLGFAPKKMSFGETIKHCFKNYANFKGRASRSEYWYFYLFGILVLFVIAMVSAALYSLVVLGLLLPFISVLTRRLHDTGRSGVKALFLFVPFIGGILLLIWLCKAGDKTANKFGPPNADAKFHA